MACSTSPGAASLSRASSRRARSTATRSAMPSTSRGWSARCARASRASRKTRACCSATRSSPSMTKAKATACAAGCAAPRASCASRRAGWSAATARAAACANSAASGCRATPIPSAGSSSTWPSAPAACAIPRPSAIRCAPRSGCPDRTARCATNSCCIRARTMPSRSTKRVFAAGWPRAIPKTARCRWCARRSIPSMRAWPNAGATAVCCWPAMPRT